MTNIKHLLVVWNDENYSNRQEAEEDGAVYECEIPSRYETSDRLLFIEAFKQGLIAGGERLANNTRSLACEVIQLHPVTVTARVLEWNDYTTTVYAESAEDAYQKVKDAGITSYKPDDVSWGMESAPSDILITQKSIHAELCN